MLEIEAAVRQMEAATLRNRSEDAEEARRRAHDMLDLHMDKKIEAITALRLRVERQSRPKG